MSNTVYPLNRVSVEPIHVQWAVDKEQGRCFPVIFWPQAMGMIIFHPAREGIPHAIVTDEFGVMSFPGPTWELKLCYLTVKPFRNGSDKLIQLIKLVLIRLREQWSLPAWCWSRIKVSLAGHPCSPEFLTLQKSPRFPGRAHQGTFCSAESELWSPSFATRLETPGKAWSDT